MNSKRDKKETFVYRQSDGGFLCRLPAMMAKRFLYIMCFIFVSNIDHMSAPIHEVDMCRMTFNIDNAILTK